MKIIILKLWTACLLLLVAIPSMAQKPKVQVSFDIASSGFFFEVFEDDVAELKSKGLTILTKGLNEYIGFIEFIPEIAPYELSITLKKDDMSANLGIGEEYLLEFKLTGSPKEPPSHGWKFLKSEEIESWEASASEMLKFLDQEWNKHLVTRYNLDLVSNLFDEIPLALPDNSHFYIRDQEIKEAILPFRIEMLNVDHINSNYLVVIDVVDKDGVPSIKQLKQGISPGVVESVMISLGVPRSLEGCVRISLIDLSNMTPTNGKVYITNYARSVSGLDIELETPTDFINSN